MIARIPKMAPSSVPGIPNRNKPKSVPVIKQIKYSIMSPLYNPSLNSKYWIVLNVNYWWSNNI